MLVMFAELLQATSLPHLSDDMRLVACLDQETVCLESDCVFHEFAIAAPSENPRLEENCTVFANVITCLSEKR